MAMAEKQTSTAPKILDTTEAPSMPWKPRVVMSGKPGKVEEPKEVKKVEKKGGGKTPPRRVGLKIGAGIGAGVLLGGGAAAYYIQHEQAQEGDRITQGEQSNPVAVITVPETKAPETTSIPTTETAPPTTETAPETTAEVIINAPAIDGLRFDKETRTYLAEANNPYGLKEGEIAGVYTPNILTIETIDGTPGNFDKGVASFPEKVIKVLQAQALKEKGEYFFPLMIDVRDVNNLFLTELKDLRGGPLVKWLGIKVPIGVNFYSILEGNFQLEFTSQEGLTSTEAIVQNYFDIKKNDMFGAFIFEAMKENLLLDTKNIKESTGKTADGKEFILRTIQLKSGDLIGRVISEEPLRFLKYRKWVIDEGEHQLMLLILGKNREQYRGGLDLQLKVDNTLTAILPKEIK